MQMEFLDKPEGKPFEFAPYALKDLVIPGYGTGVGMRKSDTKLIAQLNTALKTIRANGTCKKIADKYFSFGVYGK